MNLDFVEDNEILHRALKPNLTFWSTKDNRPTSALFKDSKGVSADRTGSRSESEIRNSGFNFGLSETILQSRASPAC